MAGVLALLALPLAAACGGGDSSSKNPGGDSPPAFIRDIYGGTEILTRGTGCWKGTCVDMAGVPTNAEPLPMTPRQQIAISFPDGRPDTFTVNWYAAPEPAPDAKDDQRLWTEIAHEPQVLSGTTAPTDLGTYVMVVSAQWPNQGNMTYGLYSEVLILPTPTPEPSETATPAP